MKTAIVIRHLDFEHGGTLSAVLEQRGYRIQALDATQDDLTRQSIQDADLLVMLGGPIGAHDEALYPYLKDELSLIQQRLAAARPMIGICLGAQMIARALGAGVHAMPAKEIGFSPLQLTAAGNYSPLAALSNTPVLHWHGDQFDLPAGAIHLARTDHCPNQAFAIGTQVLALQCHLEARPEQIERWLLGHACELSQAGIDPRSIRRHAATLQHQLPEAATAVFNHWLDAVQI